MKIIKWILLINSVLIALLSVPFILSHHINITPATLKSVFYTELIFIVGSLILLWVFGGLSNIYLHSLNTDKYEKAYKICNVIIKVIGFIYVGWYFIITNDIDRDSMMFREILNIYLLPICAYGILILTKKFVK